MTKRIIIVGGNRKQFEDLMTLDLGFPNPNHVEVFHLGNDHDIHRVYGLMPDAWYSMGFVRDSRLAECRAHFDRGVERYYGNLWGRIALEQLRPLMGLSREGPYASNVR